MKRRVQRLLSRGGRALGLAAVAVAHGQRPGCGPWHALAPDMVASAEEVMAAVGEERNPAILATALDAALGPEPTSAAPAWLGVLDEDALGRITAALSGSAKPLRGDGEARFAADPALWALALAFCRNPDAALAVARCVEDAAAGERLARWSRLAQAIAGPGEPSRMRRRLKALLAAGEAGDG
jgi:hypothetical protein